MNKKLGKPLILLTFVFILLSLLVGAVSAADIYVNGTGSDDTGTGTADNPYKTISYGIAQASGTSTDTIILAPETFSTSIDPAHTDYGITIDRNVNIRGAGQGLTIIDAGGHDSIFTINSGCTVTISDLTLTNGLEAEDVGGAINNDGTLTVNNCAFTSNTAYNGGAINNDGTLIANNCAFTSNTATSTASLPDDGGSAIWTGNTATLTNCIFTNNDASASDSAAIFNYGGTLSLTGCTFTNNRGGAIVNEYGGNLNVLNSIFTGNSATYNGGAIWNDGTCTVTGSTFTGNTAGGNGGAISNFNDVGGNEESVASIVTSLTVTGCTFVGNSATSGGAIFSSGPYSLRIIGNHILNNVGSGIYISTIYVGSTVSNGIIYEYLINFNRIYGNTPYGIFFDNMPQSVNAALVQPILDARYNWWGNNNGPNSVGADKTNMNSAWYTPWLVMRFSPSQAIISGGSSTLIVANFLYDSWGGYHDPANGHIPDGTPVVFTTTLGQVGSQQTTRWTVNAVASTFLRAVDAWGRKISGLAIISATTDAQTLSISETITANAASNTIGMQKTGLPINYLILAILMVVSGLLVPKRK